MSTPGRAEWRITLTSSRVRSISIFGMAAARYFVLMNFRTLKSSKRRTRKSFFDAYQRLFHGSVIPVRKPIGLTFCPMNSFLLVS